MNDMQFTGHALKYIESSFFTTERNAAKPR